MTILPDCGIRRAVENDIIGIDPYNESNLQPASYDLTLGTEWSIPREVPPTEQPITLDDGLPADACEHVEADGMVLRSGQDMYKSLPTAGTSSFVLGHTAETIDLPPNITAQVKGRSSIGRLGVVPHTAGWVDPGFSGSITLEFVNHSPNEIQLEAGQRIAQIVFQQTTVSAEEPYGEQSGSKYQGQSGVTDTRIDDEYE